MYDPFPDSRTDIAVAVVLAFGVDYAVKSFWNDSENHPLPKRKGGGGENNGTLLATIGFAAMYSITFSARIYLTILLVEVILDWFPLIEVFLGESRVIHIRGTETFLAIVLWAGLTLSMIKRVVLHQMVSGERLGRVALVDWLGDFIITLIVLVVVLEALNIDLGYGIRSILSAGGMGALIFSLATKDMLEQIICGVALSAWDALEVGDKVCLDDGHIEGVIRVIGLIETTIEGYDHSVVRIPNAQIAAARVSNLSNVKKSKLIQELRFKHEDIPKLPAVLAEIKEEIQLSCPKLNLKHEFYALLKSFEDDHVQGVVSAHFDVPPHTLELYKNRQEFLLAIARAMDKHEVQFAIPED